MIGVKGINLNDFIGKKLRSFSDGVLLARIATIINKKEVEKISKTAKNKASCLYNVRKSLETFRGNKNVNLRHLFNEDEI